MVKSCCSTYLHFQKVQWSQYALWIKIHATIMRDPSMQNEIILTTISCIHMHMYNIIYIHQYCMYFYTCVGVRSWGGGERNTLDIAPIRWNKEFTIYSKIVDYKEWWCYRNKSTLRWNSTITNKKKKKSLPWQTKAYNHTNNKTSVNYFNAEQK